MAEADERSKKSWVIIVEDDHEFLHWFGEVLKRSYTEHLEIDYAVDAGSALEKLRQSLPDALILDLMMPYGDARDELGSDSDPDEWNTGLILLSWLRRREHESNQKSAWVAIVTARSPLAVHTRANQLLLERGKVYYKPFDTLELEGDLARALGIPSDLPESLR